MRDKTIDVVSALNNYLISMESLGFSNEEAKLHYATMYKMLGNNAKPEAVCWLVLKYATKAITVVITPKEVQNAEKTDF